MPKKILFNEPVIYLNEEKKLIEEISIAAKEAFSLVQNSGPAHWKPINSKDGVHNYISQDNFHIPMYRAISAVDASVAEVMDCMFSPDTASFQKCNRILHDNVLDCKVIKLLKGPDENNPYFSITLKWMAFESPSLIWNRDFFFIEYTNMYTDDKNGTIGFRVMKSLSMKCCPDFSDSHKYIRGNLQRIGFIVRNKGTQGCQTKIIHLNQANPMGSLPLYGTNRLKICYGDVISKLRLYFERKQVCMESYKPKSDWPNKQFCMTCSCCVKTFGSFQPKHRCKVCGGITCGTCSSARDADLPGIGIKKIRVCGNCLENSNSRHQKQSEQKDSNCSAFDLRLSVGKREYQGAGSTDKKIRRTTTVDKPTQVKICLFSGNESLDDIRSRAQTLPSNPSRDGMDEVLKFISKLDGISTHGAVTA